MEQKYKVFMSILMLLMLTLVVNATGNVSGVVSGEPVVFPVDNTSVGVTSQVSEAVVGFGDTSLVTIPFSATYTMFDGNYYRIHDAATVGFTEVTSYSFYLPVASYVYMIVTGEIINFKGSINLEAKMDNRDNEFAGGSYYLGACNYCWTSFSQARGYYLGAGNHVVRLRGQEWWGDDRMSSVGGVSITVIANQKGSMTVR